MSLRWLVLVCALAPSAAGETLSIGGGSIELVDERRDPAIEKWVRRAAEAASDVYGRFPVDRVRIVVERRPGRGIGGTAYGGKLIQMRLGEETPASILDDDWTMTHEILHLGFPDLARRHHWMEEGLATYFEPIARARVGQIASVRVWREIFEGLPNGNAADAGLDETPTWGATYWGGALFWLLVDIDIRSQTDNRRSAIDALRAILQAGGNATVRWSVDRVIEVGDRATGTTALRTRYRSMGQRAFRHDLAALARRLGVDAMGLDDDAPLAALRRAITAAPR